MTKALLCPAAVLVLLLSACGPTKKEPDVNLAGYPAPFRAGYIDGCNSARRAAGTVRDSGRFKSDQAYAAGWRDGFDICNRQKSGK